MIVNLFGHLTALHYADRAYVAGRDMVLALLGMSYGDIECKPVPKQSEDAWREMRTVDDFLRRTEEGRT